MTTVNPSGVDVFCPLFSVGFTYLRPGPLRGHIHLPSPAPNFRTPDMAQESMQRWVPQFAVPQSGTP
jgi:hypothetical protein